MTPKVQSRRLNDHKPAWPPTFDKLPHHAFSFEKEEPVLKDENKSKELAKSANATELKADGRQNFNDQSLLLHTKDIREGFKTLKTKQNNKIDHEANHNFINQLNSIKAQHHFETRAQLHHRIKSAQPKVKDRYAFYYTK